MGLAKTEKIALLTSEYCRIEAEHNLARKYAAKMQSLTERLEWVAVASTVQFENREAVALPEKDMPVYTAAVAMKAAVLLTGDQKHFGELMRRTDLPLRVQTVSSFLLGPPRITPRD